jgi:hypothetical protein
MSEIKNELGKQPAVTNPDELSFHDVSAVRSALAEGSLNVSFFGWVLWSHANIVLEALSQWIREDDVQSEKTRAEFLKQAHGGCWLDIPSGWNHQSEFDKNDFAKQLGCSQFVGIDLGAWERFSRKEEQGYQATYKPREFLTGLGEIPTHSVNIITICGLEPLRASQEDYNLYMNAFKTELNRVLHPDGFLILDERISGRRGGLQLENSGFRRVSHEEHGCTLGYSRFFRPDATPRPPKFES